MSTIRIRTACRNDIPAMTRLLLDLFAIEVDFNPNPEAHSLGLALLIQRDDAALFVAEINGTVVGMCTVQIMISTAMGGRVGHVEDVVVAEEHRGTGIGSRLLQAAEEWAESQQLLRLQLLADQSNRPALSFYKQAHWKRTNLIACSKIILPGNRPAFGEEPPL